MSPPGFGMSRPRLAQGTTGGLRARIKVGVGFVDVRERWNRVTFVEVNIMSRQYTCLLLIYRFSVVEKEKGAMLAKDISNSH